MASLPRGLRLVFCEARLLLSCKAHEPPTEDELVHKLEEDKQRLFEETFLLKAEIESYKRSAGHVQYR